MYQSGSPLLFPACNSDSEVANCNFTNNDGAFHLMGENIVRVHEIRNKGKIFPTDLQ